MSASRTSDPYLTGFSSALSAVEDEVCSFRELFDRDGQLTTLDLLHELVSDYRRVRVEAELFQRVQSVVLGS